jgi:hypothetical protein
MLEMYQRCGPFIVGIAHDWYASSADSGPQFQTSSNTIDVRGKRADDALVIVEEKLYDKAAVGTVFVVHGVGTGVPLIACLLASCIHC